MKPIVQMHILVVAGLALLAWGGRTALAEPKVVNGGFETDRYTKQPGYADQNGKTITGWAHSGRVGVNPVHIGEDGKQTASPFADNARIPQGRHVLFMQNAARTSQKIAGFRKGKHYRLEFHENARAFNRSSTFPRLTVRLGGKTLVSPHLVSPVCKADRRLLPYARVVSDVFVPAADGEYELVFETLNTGGVSVLIDDVRILEVDGSASGE